MRDIADMTACSLGVVAEFACRDCGRACKLVIEYAELVAVKHSVSPYTAFHAVPNVMHAPVPWSCSAGGGWYPEQACPQCRAACNPQVTPREAERFLATARSNGWIAIQVEQQLAQIAKAVLTLGTENHGQLN